jgi:ribonuclease Z
MPAHRSVYRELGRNVQQFADRSSSILHSAEFRVNGCQIHVAWTELRRLVEEFATEGTVYDNDGVRVTAFEVDHGEHIKPAFGYCVDYDGRSVVISGDTRFSENLITHSADVDLIIHEVAAVRPELLADPQVKRVMEHHTSPQEVGTVFSCARPKLGVYTHLVLLARKEILALTPADLIEQTRETYDGPLEVGEDLMTFDIGREQVTMQRRLPAR